MKPFAELSREASLANRVADSILQRIVSGDYRPGDRLPSERELGDQFGVSRTVVREAVRTLAGRGVVSVRAGSGICVAAVDAAAVTEALTLLLRGSDGIKYRHVHEVRAMLEVEMAGIAADRATGVDIEAMRVAFASMGSAEGVEAAAQYDLSFHQAIARATQNPLFLVLHDAIGDALIEVRRSNLAYGGGTEAIESHRKILDAIAAHDRVGAEAFMREHLDAVERLWEATEEQWSETAGALPADASPK